MGKWQMVKNGLQMTLITNDNSDMMTYRRRKGVFAAAEYQFHR